MKHTIIFVIFIFFSHLSFTQEATLNLEWTQTRLINTTDINQGLPKVIVDSLENVFICSNTYDIGQVTGFITQKYDIMGNLLWENTYNTIVSDIMKDAALLSDGSIVVAGIREYPDFDGKIQIFRYNTNGNTLWEISYKEEANLHSSMQDMLVDKEDNIYIIGNNWHEITEQRHLTLTKIDSTGQIVWDNWYWYNEHINSYYVGLRGQLLEDRIVIFADGFSSYLIHQVDYGGQTIAIATKPYQDIFAFNVWVDKEGHTYIGDETGEYKVTKLDLNGDTLWTYIKPPAIINPNISTGSLRNIAFDEDNHIYITGHYSMQNTRVDCLTTKLDTSGNVIWEKIFRLTDLYLNDSPTTIYVDEQYVYVGGRGVEIEDTISNYNYTLVIYTLEGEEIVRTSYDHNNNKTDWPTSIFVKDNNIYISGTSDNGYEPPVTPIHALTQKYRLDISSDLPSIMEAEAHFKLHPNPAQDKVQVALDGFAIPSSTPLRIQVYNVQGRLVKVANLTSSTDLLDFKDLVAGLYFVHVMAGKESLGVEKLVVAR